MRKLIAALAFLCLSAFSFAQTAVVTGHTITGQNTTSSSGISILFELIGDNGQQCKVAGTGLITPYSSTVTQAQLAAGISLIENSQITCGTTTGATRWRYTIKSGGTGTRQCVVNITAATNLDSTACLNATSTPVTTTPTDSIYCRIDGSNCGFTGAVTDTVSFGAPLFNVTGSLNATIANDTAGGINLTANSGKTWEVANAGSLSSPPGGAVQFNGATSGLVTLNAPSVVGGSFNITVPGINDQMVTRSSTDTLTNKTLTSPAINGQTADTITQKAATQFLLKDNSGGTRFSIPPNGTSPSVLNNTTVGGASTFTGTLTTPIQGIACADLCVSVIAGTPKHLTGQTAAITNSAIGTIGTDIATGTYSAHASCITTTSGTGTTATPTITWTDAGGAKTLTLASFALNSTSITGYDNAEFPIHPTSGAVNLNVPGTFGTSVYACDAWLTREN